MLAAIHEGAVGRQRVATVSVGGRAVLLAVDTSYLRELAGGEDAGRGVVAVFRDISELESLAARAGTEAASGRKPGGRPPQEPQPVTRPKDQVNFTDPESRIMPSSEGFVQGFNAQASADNGSHLIVAGHIIPNQVNGDSRTIREHHDISAL